MPFRKLESFLQELCRCLHEIFGRPSGAFFAVGHPTVAVNQEGRHRVVNSPILFHCQDAKLTKEIVDYSLVHRQQMEIF